MLSPSSELSPQPLRPLPTASPRLVLTLSSSVEITGAQRQPSYALCLLDEAWLERLRQLQRVARQYNVEVYSDEPNLSWDRQAASGIGSSRLVVASTWFRFQGWATLYGDGYVDTDDMMFGRVDAAIELLLAARRLSQRSGAHALGASLAQLSHDCSDREIRIRLLATGDLYAGAPDDHTDIEAELLAARAARQAGLQQQPG